MLCIVSLALGGIIFCSQTKTENEDAGDRGAADPQLPGNIRLRDLVHSGSPESTWNIPVIRAQDNPCCLLFLIY